MRVKSFLAPLPNHDSQTLPPTPASPAALRCQAPPVSHLRDACFPSSRTPLPSQLFLLPVLCCLETISLSARSPPSNWAILLVAEGCGDSNTCQLGLRSSHC